MAQLILRKLRERMDYRWLQLTAAVPGALNTLIFIRPSCITAGLFRRVQAFGFKQAIPTGTLTTH